ncbi:MAG: HD domain-containing protein [Candidatus Pacebacteria bacterium]|nr:HD domain-containing protein [Candidatus Paceibacterota bacterium]
MQDTLHFLMESHKLKDVKRQGILLYGVKKSDSALEHSFRMALMAAIFGKEKKINIAKAIKIALVHDLCKVYAGDITPYEGLLPKSKKQKAELASRWRRVSLAEKGKMQALKMKKEKEALEKITKLLPPGLRAEIMNLWFDYNQGKSKEAKFIQQIDVIENLLEAFEWRLKNKEFPTLPWWEHVNETVDDPVLIQFIKEIAKAELQKFCKDGKK